MNRLLPLLPFLLAACSRGTPTATPEASAPDQSPTPQKRAYNPWQEQINALEKARGVEEMLQQAARDRNRQLQQMEQ